MKETSFADCNFMISSRKDWKSDLETVMLALRFRSGAVFSASLLCGQVGMTSSKTIPRNFQNHKHQRLLLYFRTLLASWSV
jgi:hypothetical protein